MVLDSIFFKPKNKKLAKKISIRTPEEFLDSIHELSKHGLILKERKALLLAQTRAKLQLRRKNLSKKERDEFEIISRMNFKQGDINVVFKK